MSAKSDSRPTIPPGLTPSEEAAWWDDHRDYWRGAGADEEILQPATVRKTKPVNLRLPVDMIEDLKRAAERRSLAYQTLIRMWLKERLDCENRESCR